MLKKVLLFSFAIIVLKLNITAQCPAGTWNNTGFFVGFDIPSQSGIANERTAHAAWGGDYYLFNVTAGNTYVFRTCFSENVSINTVLSLYNSTGSTLLTYNDDFCGTQSQISWLATFTGQVRLSYYQSGCTTNFIDTKLGVYFLEPCTAPSISSQPVSTTTCTSSNTSFTVAVTGTSLAYQWQVNTGSGFNNITNGGIYSNATTATLNLTGAHSAMNNYSYRCVVTGGCGSVTSNSVTLTVNANNWTGSVNNNWSTSGNWGCGVVPNSLDDVTISSGNPTVTSGTTANCRNMTKSGFASTLNLTGATLNVYGNLTYNGGSITNTTTSNINFVGSGTQTYSGSVASFTVANITMNGSGTLNVYAALSITNALNVTNGTLITNDNITLKSTASGTAYLGNITGVLTGSLLLEKFIPGRRAYRFLAHPFRSDTTIYLSILTNALNITGNGGSTNGFTTTVTNAPSAFYYNNAVAGSGSGINDLGWQAFTSTNSGANNKWDSYEGIRVLVRGALGEGLNGQAYTPSATTISMRGRVNTGNQVISLTRTGSNGYNFIGNPYPSPVDVNSTTRNNAGSTFYVWDATLGTAGQYRNISFGSSYILPAYAGFVVNATANGSITFTEASKATSATHSLFRNVTAEDNKLQLKLSTDSTIWDYCTFYFNRKGESKKDELDGEKLFNSSVNLYSVSSDNSKLSIDCRNTAQQQTIPLGIIVANQQAFTLTVDELSTTDDKLFFLRDKYLNTTVPLQAGTVYSFTTNNDSLSKGEKRFEIIQSLKEIFINTNTPEFSINPNPTSDKIIVSTTFAEKQDAILNIVASNGMLVQHKVLKNVTAINESFLLKHLASGTYTIKLSYGKKTISKQFVKQ